MRTHFRFDCRIAYFYRDTIGVLFLSIANSCGRGNGCSSYLSSGNGLSYPTEAVSGDQRQMCLNMVSPLWGRCPIDADPNVTWVNAWENGSFLVRATSIANCDATPGSYYPNADTGNGTIPTTLYIHTNNGSNPGRNGRLYEYSKRQYALRSVLAGVTIVGLWTRRNLNNNGSLGVTGIGSLVHAYSTVPTC